MGVEILDRVVRVTIQRHNVFLNWEMEPVLSRKQARLFLPLK